MGTLFAVPQRSGRTEDSAVVKKANAKTKSASATVKGGGGLFSRIDAIRVAVEKNLGQFKDDYIIIRDIDTLHDYITACLYGNIISIDTETTGLDPLLDTLVGICIYTIGKPAAYIPINHRSYIDMQRVPDQLTADEVSIEFDRIASSSINVIMFNACFDMRFLRSGLGVNIVCTWDCYLGARLLNENEGAGNNGLKKLHQKYVLHGKGDSFKFDDLFKDISFDLVPINVGYVYAAHDAIITYELYLFQKPFLTLDSDTALSRGLNDVAWVFHNIEMPCIAVVADMEDVGVSFDFDYASELHNKYHALLADKTAAVYAEIEKYAERITAYRTANAVNKLSEPINIDSPVQLAILLYDILNIAPVDDKSPRGTGEEILLKIDTDLTRAVLEYRAVGKLINTYIDKLPNCVNPKDGRIHCKFNQYGADTGRFSSSNPNLQNIPSHNKDIRKMFKATDGYVLMSSDYSQQEPKMMAQLCGDEGMLTAYRQGKDLYAQIASLSFNRDYEDCLEFRPDGTTNPDGKNRRSQAKSILLGVLYGRGVASIADQLHTSTAEAQRVKDSVFKGFPAIEEFEKESIAMAKSVGYVTTLWGRKRRLPVMRKPDYEFRWIDGYSADPLDFSGEAEIPESLIRKYVTKLNRARFGQKRKIFEQANEEGLWIDDNTKAKTDTTRQIVNARIQGSAADMSKLAMIKVGTDETLRELGFRLLIPVHDELIGECPIENAKECAERFAHLMSTAAEKLTIPISCDVEITKQWYGEDVKL